MSKKAPVKKTPVKKVAPKKTAAQASAKKKAQPKPKKKAAAPAHRPSSYSPAMAEKVCELLMQGYTLRQIERRPGMVAKSTICRWLAQQDDFRDRYARAHEIKAMMMEDEILDIADDSSNDWIEREGAEGEPIIVLNSEAIQRSRARIDARKWLMAKAAPKRYADRVAVTGKDDGPVEHTHTLVSELVNAVDGADTGIGAARSRSNREEL